jgi:hypothetical protein
MVWCTNGPNWGKKMKSHDLDLKGGISSAQARRYAGSLLHTYVVVQAVDIGRADVPQNIHACK